jgi:predicted TIM-barrel fold metal-dependent hydrolase
MIDPSYVRKNFPVIRPEWHALTVEEVLEPALPIIDTHHHLWQLPESTYLRDELIADLRSGHAVRGTVFVDCHSAYREDGPEPLKPVGETEFVVRETEGAAPGACAGIVGWADLMLGDFVQDVLESHVQAGRGRFRGIRSRAAWHENPEVHPAGLASPHMLLDPRVQQAARRLGTMGLTLDVWVYHTQLAEVAQLADACPDTQLVLDHCGGPLGVGRFEGRRDAVFEEWKRELRKLADRANVAVKLGGLAMPRAGFRLHERERPAGSAELARLWAPYIETCVEAFGVRRCTFESNFPVDKGACSYRLLWIAFKRLAAANTASE